MLGSGSRLTDTATLSGGNSPTGMITFTLYNPSNAVVDTETVTVTDNGSYSTPNGYTPPSAGTYQWVASFSGDANNNTTASTLGSDPEIVNQASTTTTVTSSTGGTSVFGQSITLTATVSGSGGTPTAR